MRASQINGCAHCLDMHSKDAEAQGESEQRLHLLAAWREAPVYSDRERAALAWCEALTLLPQTGAPDHADRPLVLSAPDSVGAIAYLDPPKTAGNKTVRARSQAHSATHQAAATQ